MNPTIIKIFVIKSLWITIGWKIYSQLNRIKKHIVLRLFVYIAATWWLLYEYISYQMLFDHRQTNEKSYKKTIFRISSYKQFVIQFEKKRIYYIYTAIIFKYFIIRLVFLIQNNRWYSFEPLCNIKSSKFIIYKKEVLD